MGFEFSWGGKFYHAGIRPNMIEVSTNISLGWSKFVRLMRWRGWVLVNGKIFLNIYFFSICCWISLINIAVPISVEGKNLIKKLLRFSDFSDNRVQEILCLCYKFFLVNDHNDIKIMIAIYSFHYFRSFLNKKIQWVRFMWPLCEISFFFNIFVQFFIINFISAARVLIN